MHRRPLALLDYLSRSPLNLIREAEGSIYREEPRDVHERMFKRSTQAGHGGSFLRHNKTGDYIIHPGGKPGTRKDERRGHLKGQAVSRSASGRKVTIHYWEHPKTGNRIHLKFK